MRKNYRLFKYLYLIMFPITLLLGSFHSIANNIPLSIILIIIVEYAIGKVFDYVEML